MKSLVIYESAFGNTKAVAEAIATALGAAGPSSAHPLATLQRPLDDVDLLVVGCPTHTWGMPRRSTWPADAGVPPSPLLRDWLPSAPRGLGRPAATFATRLSASRLFTGSAAGAVGRRLRRRGWNIIGRRSFVVIATRGPLDDDELDVAPRLGGAIGRCRERCFVAAAPLTGSVRVASGTCPAEHCEQDGGRQPQPTPAPSLRARPFVTQSDACRTRRCVMPGGREHEPHRRDPTGSLVPTSQLATVGRAGVSSH